jgi:hypothetical protein
MAGLDLTPIGTSGKRTPLADLDTTLIETVEEAYAYCAANPGERLQTPWFPTRDAADAWLSDARAYAYHREAGRLVVSGNTAKHPVDRGKYVARFSVTEYVAKASETQE